MVFICNNNQYAYSTPLNRQMACANVADRGPAYNMPAEIVDGNDVLAVHAATRRALMHVRCRQRALPAGVQDLPHDRPLRARCRPLRSARTVRGVGQARPDHASGSQDAETRTGPSRPRLTKCAPRIREEIDEAVAWAELAPSPTPRRCSTAFTKANSPMPTTYLEAIREGLWEEMERDPNVFLLGEDIGVYGGAFKVTDGFFEHFGEKRVVDTPDLRRRHRRCGHRRQRLWGCGRWRKCSSPISSPAASTRL